MKMKAMIGVMYLHIKERQRLSKSPELERHEINSLIQLSEVTNTADTLISDFYPPELLDNKLFSHPVCGVLLWLHWKINRLR